GGASWPRWCPYRHEYFTARGEGSKPPLLAHRPESGPFVVPAPDDARGPRPGRRRPVPARPDQLGLAGPRPRGGREHPPGVPALGAPALVGFVAAVPGHRPWLSRRGRPGRRAGTRREDRLWPGSAA